MLRKTSFKCYLCGLPVHPIDKVWYNNPITLTHKESPDSFGQFFMGSIERPSEPDNDLNSPERRPLPSLSELVKAVDRKFRSNEFVLGPDGRRSAIYDSYHAVDEVMKQLEREGVDMFGLAIALTKETQVKPKPAVEKTLDLMLAHDSWEGFFNGLAYDILYQQVLLDHPEYKLECRRVAE